MIFDLLSESDTELIIDLFKSGMIKFGNFTLKSGKTSSIYIDLRVAISYPVIFEKICNRMYTQMRNKKYDFICGVPYSALTFASAIAYAHAIPMLLKRKEAKDYGTKKMLEGVYKEGQSCLLLEDTVTTGGSIIETAKLLQDHGIIVTDVCYFIDRKQGGVENLEREGLNVTYVFSLDLIIQVLFWKQCITVEQHDQALISLGL